MEKSASTTKSVYRRLRETRLVQSNNGPHQVDDFIARKQRVELVRVDPRRWCSTRHTRCRVGCYCDLVSHKMQIVHGQPLGHVTRFLDIIRVFPFIDQSSKIRFKRLSEKFLGICGTIYSHFFVV